MKTIIEKIRSNVFLSVIIAIILGLIVLYVSRFIDGIIKGNILDNIDLNFYTGNLSFKLLILILSIGVILLVNNGSLKGYGFNKPYNLKIGKTLLISIGIFIASFIVGNLIFNIILRNIISTGDMPKGFSTPNSIIEMILVVWIWSSICEEVLTRGLVQSFMNNHTKIKFIKLSIPVWISGLFFGAMHLMLLKTDMDLFYVSFIVFNTTVVGVLAAYYREKTKSVYTAIFLHFLPLVLKKIL